MLDWNKALLTVKAHQRKHHLKAERLNKKGHEGRDVYHYVYVRHTLELADKIKDIRSILKTLEKIDTIRHRKVVPRNKLAGRNRREVKH